jgi:hypothetical protein
LIRIEDSDNMNIDDPFDLLGLFQGIGLPLRAQSAPTHNDLQFWRLVDPQSPGAWDSSTATPLNQ